MLKSDTELQSQINIPHVRSQGNSEGLLQEGR